MEIVVPDLAAAFGSDRRFAPLIDGDGARAYYRAGYFQTARSAALSLVQHQGANRSAMPVLFLYRHYLELALKDAWHHSQAFDLGQLDQKFGHDLMKLWQETKRVLAGFADKGSLQTLDAIVGFFHDADERADAFRYAVKHDGKKQFAAYGAVNVEALVTEMDRAHEIVEAGIATMHEEECEMDAAIEDAVARDKD